MKSLAPKFLPRMLPRELPPELLFLRNGMPRKNLIAYTRPLQDSIGLSVDDYDNIGATWQAVFFTDSTMPIVFNTFADLWAAVSVVGSFNDENVVGTEAKGVAVYDVTTSRSVLNKALRWFGLPIVGGWVDLENFSDGDYFTY